MADLSREIRRTTKEFIVAEFLPGESSETVDDETPLITGRLLDSLAITRLVIFLEETHGIEFQSHEITAVHMDTLAKIARTVLAKIESGA